LFHLISNSYIRAKNCQDSTGWLALPDSQLLPVYPGLHSHSYPFVLAIHAESWKQGVLAHSSISAKLR